MPKHNSVKPVNPVAHTNQMPVSILSLNVCGIKSKLLSVDFVGFINDCDIICFIETKCDDVDMINMKDRMENHGFDIVYKNMSKISRFKSGGRLFAIKKDVSSKWKLMRSEFDSLLSVKTDKRSVCLDR